MYQRAFFQAGLTFVKNVKKTHGGELRSSMSVFHVFKIIQMVSNIAKQHLFQLFLLLTLSK